MKKAIPTFLLLCALTEVAAGHGFARYLSTPITPPEEFRWWFPISVAILLCGTFVVMWRVLKRPWLTAIRLSVYTIALFAVSYFIVGHIAATMTTAPPPGLGFPHPTFWGMGWTEVGWLFLRWNVYGYGFFLGALFLCSGVRRTRERFIRPALCALVLYVAALPPYVVTGALAHGWAGGYVRGGCDRRLRILNEALVECARSHGGRLPAVDGMDDLLRELKPFLSEDRIRYVPPVDVCPTGSAYERQPERYGWDRSFSGIDLRDVGRDPSLKEKAAISCPYHLPIEGLGPSTLWERISDMENAQDPKKSHEGDGR